MALLIRDLLSDGKALLSQSGISEVDAEHLMAHALGIGRMDLHNPVTLEKTLATVKDESDFEDYFAELIERRCNHEPLQYITGRAYFRNLIIEVGPGVLVPRPESELLVEAVLQHISNLPGPVSVVDLGAGSGALGLALATESDKARVALVENSPEALVWLHKNVAAIAEDTRIVESDVADALLGVKCDVVIANPPYIPDLQELPRDVVAFEPHAALFGGAQGMDIPARFIEAAARLLKSGGLLVIEHGEEQGAAIASLLSHEFEDIVAHQDLTQRPRWTSAIRR